MSDQHPNGEDIARMLREQGPAKAPPDLADEVLRQVRAEAPPKPARRFRIPRPRAVLVPALGLAGAAALVFGIAHLGSMSGSSSSAGASSAESGAGGGTAAAPLRHPAAGKRAFAIPAQSAKTLSTYGALVPPSPSGLSTNATSQAVAGHKAPYTLTVKGAQYDQALARLRFLSAAHKQHQHEPSVVVTLRRKP
jgi:hypothetical protein